MTDYTPRENRVYRALNVPRTIMGVDGGLFFMSIGFGWCLYYFCNTLLGALAAPILMLNLFRRVQRIDPRILQIIGVTNKYQYRTRYDAGKIKPVEINLC